MDKLGLYLLVSLFFVVGAMFEFAIVLLMKRWHDKRLSTQKHYNIYQNQGGSACKTNCKETKNIKTADTKDLNITTQKVSYKSNSVEIAFVDRGLDSSKELNQAKDTDDVYQSRRFSWDKLSSNHIDFAALFLFTTCYALFNSIYWVSLM